MICDCADTTTSYIKNIADNGMNGSNKTSHIDKDQLYQQYNQRSNAIYNNMCYIDNHRRIDNKVKLCPQ